MNITIKTNLFKTKEKLIKDKKTLVSAKTILEYCPSTPINKNEKSPIYLLSDDGKIFHIYDTNKECFLLQDTTVFNPAFREKNGAPMTFSKNDRSYYVTPRGQVYDTTRVNEVCFSRAVTTNNPNHNLVFVIDDSNKPILLYKAEDFDLVDSYESFPIIGRAFRNDTIHNFYAPLLLSSTEELSRFCYVCPESNIIELAQYSSDIKKYHKQVKPEQRIIDKKEYLDKVIKHFKTLAAGKGEMYTIENIPQHIRKEEQIIKLKHASNRGKSSRISDLNVEIIATEDSLNRLKKNYSYNFDSIEQLSSFQANWNKQIKDLEKQIKDNNLEIAFREKNITKLKARKECLEYIDTLQSLISQDKSLRIGTSLAETKVVSQSKTQENPNPTNNSNQSK